MRSLVARTFICVCANAMRGRRSPDLLLAGSIDRSTGDRRYGGAAMSHYKSNLRDITFNLFEVLRRQDLLGAPPYPELDEQTARSILDEVNRLATGPLADSFAEADRNPPVFDPAAGTVRLPEGFKRSYRAYMDAQWWRLHVPAGLGGIGAPRSLGWAVAELVLGANPAIWMYASGPSMAQVLWLLGTPE